MVIKISNKNKSIIEALLRQKRVIDTRLDKILCNQCGECCHRIDFSADPPRVLKEYCNQLEWRNGKAYCKIYPNHIGYKISETEECCSVQYVFFRPKSCPYNLIYPLREENLSFNENGIPNKHIRKFKERE